MLLDHHLAALQARGLKPETIEAANITSIWDPFAMAEILNWNGPAKKLGQCIKIPYYDREGNNGYTRLRPDVPRKSKGKPVKYEAPIGTALRIYLPPTVAACLDNPQVDLVITEGEFKALVSTQTGFPAIGLPGVWAWKLAKKVRLIPALENIAWKGRKVYIIFDSDITEKEGVQAAECQLAMLLTNLGAVVKCVRLPDGPPNADGKPAKLGLDDFLASLGPDGGGALQQLMWEASDPVEPDGADIKNRGDDLDPATEARKMLDSVMVDGVPKLAYWRSSFWRYSPTDCCYRELPDDDARGSVVLALNAIACRLTNSHISNHMVQLKAQAGIPSWSEQPSWRTDFRPWPASEMLPTKSGLIHLPSYIRAKASTRPPTRRVTSRQHAWSLDSMRTHRLPSSGSLSSR